jgi:glycosyltransferase involved in cell wall biosynthesis
MVRVSVITPVFNGMNFIGEAISSVAQSTYLDYEHIIVDDGSTDETMKVIREAILSLDPEGQSKVKVFSKSNSGEADTDNFAIRLSTGEFVVVLNADDILDPKLIQISVNVMLANESVVVSYPDWAIIDGAGQIGRHVKTKNFSMKRLIGDFDCLPGPGACIRKSALGEELLRNPEFSLISDYECWQRLALKGKFLRIPETLAYWRLHGENLSLKSRGGNWASQAILVAEQFFKSPALSSNRKLRNLARLGLSRAYLLAALQGNWDAKVPSLSYLFKSLRLGFIGGRLIAIRDTPLIVLVLLKSLERTVRKS